MTKLIYDASFFDEMAMRSKTTRNNQKFVRLTQPKLIVAAGLGNKLIYDLGGLTLRDSNAGDQRAPENYVVVRRASGGRNGAEQWFQTESECE